MLPCCFFILIATEKLQIHNNNNTRKTYDNDADSQAGRETDRQADKHDITSQSHHITSHITFTSHNIT